MDIDISSVNTNTVLSAYIGKWGDFGDENSVKYTVADIEQPTGDNAVAIPQPKTWCIKIEIKDNDKDSIIAELEKIRGFGKFGGETSVVSSGTFYVRLWNGKVTSDAPTE